MGLGLAIGLLYLCAPRLVASQTPAVITVQANDTELVYTSAATGNSSWSKVLQGCGSVYMASSMQNNSVSLNFAGEPS